MPKTNLETKSFIATNILGGVHGFEGIITKFISLFIANFQMGKVNYIHY